MAHDLSGLDRKDSTQRSIDVRVNSTSLTRSRAGKESALVRCHRCYAAPRREIVLIPIRAVRQAAEQSPVAIRFITIDLRLWNYACIQFAVMNDEIINLV